MDRAEALTRLGGSRIGHLGSVTPAGHPHLVPVTFALVGDSIVTAVDQKPKTTMNLQRLANVEYHRRATILADHYQEDWAELWWVRIAGPAVVHSDGHSWEAAREALTAKYDQYRRRPPEGPSIHIEIDKVTFWESTP